MRRAAVCLLLVSCRSEPNPPAPPASASAGPTASEHQFPPEDPRLEQDAPHPGAEVATIFSSSGIAAVMPTAEGVERLIALTRSVLDGGAPRSDIGDFALSSHAASARSGVEVQIVATGPGWYQIAIQLDGQWKKGFVPNFMVRRAPYEAPLDVPIAELLGEYKANELRADGKWKGKQVRTFGTVGQVGKTLDGRAFVSLQTGPRLEIPSAQCFLDDSADPEAVSLSAGAKATVQGRVERLLGNVMLKGCVVNPMAHLCRKLKEATGGTECSRYSAKEQTGDVTAIMFEDNAKHDVGLLGILSCFGDDEKSTAAEKYPFMLKSLSERGVVVGSARAACLIQLDVVGPKRSFPEPLRAKVAAFLEAL